MTPPQPWTDDLDRLLTRLLAEGAELAVSHPDGTPAFRAALARHHRVDTDSGAIWILPLVGGYQTESGYAFDLQTTRRRNLTFHTVAADDDQLAFELITDQRAVVRPAGADVIGELRRWDTYYAGLDADTKTALDALTADTL